MSLKTALSHEVHPILIAYYYYFQRENSTPFLKVYLMETCDCHWNYNYFTMFIFL